MPPHSDDPVLLTAELVRTPSVNPSLEEGGTGEAGVADLAASWLASWGYDVEVPEVSPGRYNVVARRGRPGGPSLLLNGHLDTVGVAGMTSPFSAEVRDGKLYGRGACDMKAGVAAALATASRLSGDDLDGELIIALTADEEHASLGMQALVATGIRADAAVVCEPTELRVMPAHKGFLWAEVRVQGRAAHGSRPEVGVDAIVHMGSVLGALEEEDARLARETDHGLLGPASIHAGTISGGAAASIYPDRCTLVLERRTLPGEGPEGLMRELESMVDRAKQNRPGLDVDVEGGLFRAGTEVDVADPWVQDLLRTCRDEGADAGIDGMSAWVDACFLNQAGTPALCYGPGSIAQAHGNVEWVETEQIVTCAAVLTAFARNFLSPGASTGSRGG